jgi:hypothetical protein
VTLIFCPGFRLFMSIPAELPEGFGITFTGALLADLKLLAEGFGDAFGEIVALGFDFVLAEVLPSSTVTLIFCPGVKFSTLTSLFDLSAPIFGGVIVNGFFEAIGEADGEGFGDGVTEGFGEGVGFAVGVGEGVGIGEAEGVGIGEAEGVGEGDGVGVGGSGATPFESGALGAGGLGVVETFVTCSGFTATEGSEGSDSPTEVTVMTVNVYNSPLVRLAIRTGDEVTDLVSPVSTTVIM